MFLHELQNAKEIFDTIAYEKKISPVIVEKDYWLMHTLWFLKQKRLAFDLKGGTSLSKGYDIIHRFSEDIDIKIIPPISLKTGKNHVEWWCLFHIPKVDHAKMIERFAAWLKPEGILEFTSGDCEYEHTDSEMLDQSLNFYSLDPKEYEKYLQQNGFKILLKEYDQPQHLVWVAKKV